MLTEKEIQDRILIYKEKLANLLNTLSTHYLLSENENATYSILRIREDVQKTVATIKAYQNVLYEEELTVEETTIQNCMKENACNSNIKFC